MYTMVIYMIYMRWGPGGLGPWWHLARNGHQRASAQSSCLLRSFRTRDSHAVSHSVCSIDRRRRRTIDRTWRQGMNGGAVSLQGQQTDPQRTGECTLYMTCILMCLVVVELDPSLVFVGVGAPWICICICAVPINSYFSFLT